MNRKNVLIVSTNGLGIGFTYLLIGESESIVDYARDEW